MPNSTHSNLPEVDVIFGPTASGKTALAVECALATSPHAAIINADAMQCYKGLPILTAQPNATEQRGVGHYLFSDIALTETLTAAQWVTRVLQLLESFTRQNTPVIIVGGTGFYLNSLMQGLSHIPDIDPAVSEALEQHSTQALYAMLQACDPELALKLQPMDRQRVLRGVAVFQALGEKLSALQALPRITHPYQFRTTLLQATTMEWLETRIKTRVHIMLDMGALDEIKAVKAQNLPSSARGLKAHGYKYFCAYLDGAISLPEAIDATVLETRQYAKRQQTWGRTQFAAQQVLFKP